MGAEPNRTNNTCVTSKLCPLTGLHVAESGIIQELGGGVDFRSRVAALGFTPGVEIRMLQNRGHGPVLVTLRDTRIALGRGEASKILVLPMRG
jgi:ferrous iron transport protein A